MKETRPSAATIPPSTPAIPPMTVAALSTLVRSDSDESMSFLCWKVLHQSNFGCVAGNAIRSMDLRQCPQVA